MQSDQGLHCPPTESLDTAHEQDDLNMCSLHSLKAPFACRSPDSVDENEGCSLSIYSQFNSSNVIPLFNQVQ